MIACLVLEMLDTSNPIHPLTDVEIEVHCHLPWVAGELYKCY